MLQEINLKRTNILNVRGRDFHFQKIFAIADFNGLLYIIFRHQCHNWISSCMQDIVDLINFIFVEVIFKYIDFIVKCIYSLYFLVSGEKKLQIIYIKTSSGKLRVKIKINESSCLTYFFIFKSYQVSWDSFISKF